MTGRTETIATISIHALLAESDVGVCKSNPATADFYPRSPCGERPDMEVSYSKGIKISIHALLAESDNISHFFKPNKSNFYPRSPCGERPRRHRGNDRCPIHFYPRSPCGERLAGDVWACRWPDISIHALLAESDRLSIAFKVIICLFLSTLSLRRATAHKKKALARL